MDAMATVTRYGESDWILWPSLALFVVTALLSYLVPWKLVRLVLVVQARVFEFIFTGVAVPSLTSSLLKGLIGRARRCTSIRPVSSVSASTGTTGPIRGFPSGHATTAFALAAVLGGFLSARWFIPALVLAVAIGVSRVALGVHYPSDVMGGAILGLAGAYWVRTLFANRRSLFVREADGSIHLRPLVALRRYISLKRRGSVRAQR